jgi:hypothetical protein
MDVKEFHSLDEIVLLTQQSHTASSIWSTARLCQHSDALVLSEVIRKRFKCRVNIILHAVWMRTTIIAVEILVDIEDLCKSTDVISG